MELTELQRRLKERYGSIDESSGPLFLLSVLMEECGELASALRHHEENAAKEAVDVVFCALSIANLLNTNVERALCEKYLYRTLQEVTRSWTDIDL
ncbi:MAG: MazG nucleotide pyrophosphohydrolase domain-containing protein [Halobacteriota archaeon]